MPADFAFLADSDTPSSSSSWESILDRWDLNRPNFSSSDPSVPADAPSSSSSGSLSADSPPPGGPSLGPPPFSFSVYKSEIVYHLRLPTEVKDQDSYMAIFGHQDNVEYLTHTEIACHELVLELEQGKKPINEFDKGDLLWKIRNSAMQLFRGATESLETFQSNLGKYEKLYGQIPLEEGTLIEESMKLEKSLEGWKQATSDPLKSEWVRWKEVVLTRIRRLALDNLVTWRKLVVKGSDEGVESNSEGLVEAIEEGVSMTRRHSEKDCSHLVDVDPAGTETPEGSEGRVSVRVGEVKIVDQNIFDIDFVWPILVAEMYTESDPGYLFDLFKFDTHVVEHPATNAGVDFQFTVTFTLIHALEEDFPPAAQELMRYILAKIVRGNWKRSKLLEKGDQSGLLEEEEGKLVIQDNVYRVSIVNKRPHKSRSSATEPSGEPSSRKTVALHPIHDIFVDEMS